MSLPVPEPGLVISYAYLWRHEHDKKQEEGRKTRPCVIVLAIENKNNETIVTVVPVTHRKPDETTDAVELPLKVKQHLGFDSEPAWMIITEVNQFTWPGYDLRPISNKDKVFAYGFLPPKLFGKLKNALLSQIAQRRLKISSRDHAS